MLRVELVRQIPEGLESGRRGAEVAKKDEEFFVGLHARILSCRKIHFQKSLTPSNARYMIVRMTGEALKGHLDLLLLAILADGPAHGYAVIESLRGRSGGQFDLPEGTVYPALHRLESQGLLGSRWSEESARRKRIYHLTPKGQQVLSNRQVEWKKFSKAVNATVGI